MLRGDEASEGRFKDLKLEMSSLDIAAITFELRPLIKEKYVDNIYQIDNNTFLFRFRPGDLNLVVEVGKRIHLTKYEVQIPREPTQFCMALRKRLRGGRLVDVQQHEFERIVILHVETSDGAYQVIVELFRRGNLIAVDASGRISLALSYAKMRDRNLIKGETFRHAPASGLNPFKQWAEGLSLIKRLGSIPTTKALAVTFSIGGPLAKEILLRSGLKDMPVTELTDSDSSMIQQAIEKLHSELQDSNLNPSIIISDKGEPCDITPVPFRSYESNHQRKCTTFNEAADEYFTTLTQRTTLSARRIEVTKDEQRLTRMRDMQQKQLEELSQAIEENTVKGQLIIKYLHQIQWLKSEILARKDELCPEKMVSEIRKTLADKNVPIQLTSADFKKGIIHLEIEKAPVSLRLSHRPQDEADRYFSAAKKAKEKMIGLRRAIEETIEKMKVIEDKKRQTEKTSGPKKKRVRLWYEKFRWFHSSEGSLVLAGRDATTNELLIKKYTSPGDIILHAEVHGAPFVVIKNGSKPITDSTILEAAQFAVSNSVLWKQQVASGDVYWVRPEQVSKKAPSGQYLARGAFMITGKRNYVRGVKLGLAVGAQLKEGGVEIIGGPPSAVQTRSEAYVEILPGTVPRHDLAKRIATELSNRLKFKPLDVDRILEFLPSGPGEIVSRA